MAHLTEFGKRLRLLLAVKVVGNHHQDGKNTMFVWDRKRGSYYLIDTGADESVFPASPTDRQHCSTTQHLAAANDSRIATWGQRNIIVHLDSHSFTRSFHIADVRQPILGADFLVSNNLAVDLRGRRLVDLFSYTVLSFRRQPHWDHTSWASTESGQMTMTWSPFSMDSLNYWFHVSMPPMKTCMEWSTI